MSKTSTSVRERARLVWATRYRKRTPCLWGSRRAAVEGCDPGEDVVRVKVQVVEKAKLTAAEKRRLGHGSNPFDEDTVE